MSEINPDFSFPSTRSSSQHLEAPQNNVSAPSMLVGSAPPTVNGFGQWTSAEGRPASYSPQSRPKKHMHRRSAAMSEDLSAVELATLLTPQMPTANTFSSPSIGSNGTSYNDSPKSFSNSLLSAPHTPLMRPSSFQPLSVNMSQEGSEESPRPDSMSRVSFINSPSPRRQLGEPGQLVPPPVLSLTSKPSQKHPLDAPPQRESPQNSRQMSHNTADSSLLVSSAKTDEQTRKEKRRKRRSFAQLFRKSVDLDTEKPRLSPKGSPTEDADATIVPGHNHLEPFSDAYQQRQSLSPTPIASAAFSSSYAGDSPLVTPRNSGEMVRDKSPTEPTIDLDEALSCSFQHRGTSEAILESPFSKTSSIMGAVPEEEYEDDERDSESASLNSIPLRRPVSILQKANSVTSLTSSRRHSPASPRHHPESQVHSQYSNVSLREKKRSISYVGPVSMPKTSSSLSPRSYPSRGESPDSTPPLAASPPRSPSRSPRVSFEQVSNLAIADPQQHQDYETKLKLTGYSSLTQRTMAIPSSPPASSLKKGHARRRSLIDRLMRRA